MSVKFKYALPILQMLLAVVLLIWTERWERAELRAHSVSGTPPPFSLLCAINTPVALPRELWYRYLPGWWDDIVFVATIGVFWYWVALNIHSWGQSRRVFMFSWAPLRLAGDAVAIGIGAFWVFIFWREPLRHYMPVSWPNWIVPLMALTILWSVMLIFFFGRDLMYCILRKDPLSSAPNRV